MRQGKQIANSSLFYFSFQPEKTGFFKPLFLKKIINFLGARNLETALLSYGVKHGHDKCKSNYRESTQVSVVFKFKAWFTISV
jgi:hypothetical protein